MVSSEIENLQKRSFMINNKLEHRRVVEQTLGPAVEELSVPPVVVVKLSEGSIDQDWIVALAALERRLDIVDRPSQVNTAKIAESDLKPLINDLKYIVRSLTHRYSTS